MAEGSRLPEDENLTSSSGSASAIHPPNADKMAEARNALLKFVEHGDITIDELSEWSELSEDECRAKLEERFEAMDKVRLRLR